MAKLSGGEALVKSLVREGVEVVFGLPGVQMYGIVAALRDEPSIKFVVTRNEAATTYMADGYARTTGSLGLSWLFRVQVYITLVAVFLRLFPDHLR